MDDKEYWRDRATRAESQAFEWFVWAIYLLIALVVYFVLDATSLIWFLPKNFKAAIRAVIMVSILVVLAYSALQFIRSKFFRKKNGS